MTTNHLLIKQFVINIFDMLLKICVVVMLCLTEIIFPLISETLYSKWKKNIIKSLQIIKIVHFLAFVIFFHILLSNSEELVYDAITTYSSDVDTDFIISLIFVTLLVAVASIFGITCEEILNRKNYSSIKIFDECSTDVYEMFTIINFILSGTIIGLSTYNSIILISSCSLITTKYFSRFLKINGDKFIKTPYVHCIANILGCCVGQIILYHFTIDSKKYLLIFGTVLPIYVGVNIYLFSKLC